MKKIISFLITALAGYITYYFFTNNETLYAVISCVVAFVFLYIFIISLFEKSDPYQAKLNKILKTYDSILVEIECLPKISDKKIVNTKYFKDLVNVQFEVRKPIYYLRDALFCDFLVIGNDTVYIYTLKSDKEYKSNLEELLEKEDKKEEIEKLVVQETVNEDVKDKKEEIDEKNDEVSVEETDKVDSEKTEEQVEEVSKNDLDEKEKAIEIREETSIDENDTKIEAERLEDMSDEDLDKIIEELKKELKKFSE